MSIKNEDHYFQFISVDTWYLTSDLVIDAKYKKGNPFYLYTEELDALQFKKNPIILVKTDLFYDYIDILMKLQYKFVLITCSNDDHCLPQCHKWDELSEVELEKATRKKNQFETFLSSPNLKKWFLKNPSIEHQNMQILPISLKSQWKTTRWLGEDQSANNIIFNKYCVSPEYHLKRECDKTELLYFNFANTTSNPFFLNHKGQRVDCKRILLKKGFKWTESQNFENYIANMHKYYFCVCCNGRGIDTHRVYEAMNCGAIPIVITSHIDYLYRDLPVLIIRDWEEITPTFLKEKYREMKHKKYNFKMLFPSYWVELIKTS